MTMLRTLNALQRHTAEWTQNENAALVYRVNWGGLYADVLTSTWTSAGGAVLAGGAITGLETSIRVSGSLGGFDIVNQITTTAGDTDERVIRVVVRADDRVIAHGDYGERWWGT